MKSNLECRISNDGSSVIDETARAEGLNPLRERNFSIILDEISSHGSGRGKLLDVGCAHGWFLSAAKKAGFEASGIEPDAQVAAQCAQQGNDVRVGFFPDVLSADQKFCVIVFNDVFEHLPDADAAMVACLKHLEPKGLLVLNLPSSKGVFYRIASVLTFFGVEKPFERMWQKGFPSPHLTYFSPVLMQRLARKYGLVSVSSRRLHSISVTGLWQRLRYDTKAPVLFSAIVWCGTVALAPVLRWLPSDISLEIFQA